MILGTPDFKTVLVNNSSQKWRFYIIYIFCLVGGNAVEIMEGSDEGVFAWMTVNFLLGALGGSGIANSKPTIDLGGGSMQLTFHPKDSATVRDRAEK